ncbi:MAG TPA: hypothetical protein PLB88_09460, partial [Thermoanaerobaculaceae bacterium]|nr:hypothetical protein [Thermoanaerobaculaceae bacterium]
MQQTNEALPREILDSGTKLLVNLCSISSASGDIAGVRAVAERIAAELARHGLATEVVSEPDDDGNVLPLLVARGSEAGVHPLLLVGHLDTVLDAVPPRI